jgi:predicted RNase H-like HicB family nuclease
MATIVKDLAYYMALPYTMRITPPDAESNEWFAVVEGLECHTYADTYEGLLPMIEDAKRTIIEYMLEYGDPIPEPVSD